MAESIIQYDRLTDVSSQVSVLRSGVESVKMFVSGRTAYLSFRIRAGVTDQSNVLNIPSKYKPKTAVTFAPFYMNGADMQKGCCAYIYAGSATAQFRATTAPTGSSGVDFSASWPF